jgi:hypothetical protein
VFAVLVLDLRPAASYFQIAAVALADMAQVCGWPRLNEACHLVRLWEIGGDPFEGRSAFATL